MRLRNDERTALFIDGPNCNKARNMLGMDIDYKKLYEYFQDNCRLVRAIYYTAKYNDNEFNTLRKFLDFLDYNGFQVVTKPVKVFTDSEGFETVKGNMDIEIAIHMMQLQQNLDHVVLFSGDGDFRSLVQAVQDNGRRVSVVSTLQTRPPVVADELRRQADQFVELSELVEEIESYFERH